uniref:Putative ovule protein n=1 Tax=Solanum chacoense TaxID=4108 RepID=A0A0V0GJJ8_SOLCH
MLYSSNCFLVLIPETCSQKKILKCLAHEMITIYICDTPVKPSTPLKSISNIYYPIICTRDISIPTILQGMQTPCIFPVALICFISCSTACYQS